jgi:hypothetical protein
MSPMSLFLNLYYCEQFILLILEMYSRYFDPVVSSVKKYYHNHFELVNIIQVQDSHTSVLT